MTGMKNPASTPQYPENIFVVEEADDGLFDLITDRHGDRNYRPFNRGSKLKDTVLQPKIIPKYQTIWGSHNADESLEVRDINMHPAIMMKRDDDVFNDNPFEELNLASYWHHPHSVAEFQDMPSAMHTIKSQALDELSNTCMELIENEQELGKILGSFTRFIMGDDPIFKDIDLDTFVDKELRTESRELAQKALCMHSIFQDRLFSSRTKMKLAQKRKDNLLKNKDIFPDDEEVFLEENI